MLAQHIRLKLKNDGVIAPTVKHRRILAKTILHKGQHFGLFAFAMADTHIH